MYQPIYAALLTQVPSNHDHAVSKRRRTSQVFEKIFLFDIKFSIKCITYQFTLR